MPPSLPSAPTYHVGYRAPEVPGSVLGLRVLVVVLYPTATPPQPTPVGGYLLDVTPAAPVAAGAFPVVLVSHGTGGSGGTYRLLAHYRARRIARLHFPRKKRCLTLMKQPAKQFRALETVTDYTRFYGLPAPVHPLLTLIDLRPFDGSEPPPDRPDLLAPVVPRLYTVFLNSATSTARSTTATAPTMFREGVMGFSPPGQVFHAADNLDTSPLSGWMLVFHPDLLRRHPLAPKPTAYGFFG